MSRTERDLVHQFAAHAAGLQYDTLPGEARDAARKSVLDTLGVILAASGMEPAVRPVIEIVKDAGGKPDFTLSIQIALTILQLPDAHPADLYGLCVGGGAVDLVPCFPQVLGHFDQPGELIAVGDMEVVVLLKLLNLRDACALGGWIELDLGLDCCGCHDGVEDGAEEGSQWALAGCSLSAGSDGTVREWRLKHTMKGEGGDERYGQQTEMQRQSEAVDKLRNAPASKAALAPTPSREWLPKP